MKVLIVPDSFKGSLSSAEVIDIISETLYRKVEDCEILGIPIADGGEGSVDVILKSNGGDRIYCEVSDPIGRKITAYYGLSDKTYIFEMAQASGLTRLEKHERNIDVASTYGTGEMIKHALDKTFDFENIVRTEPLVLIIGIGGSATNDGGTGFAKALGVKFYDANNRLIEDEGAQILGRIAKIDRSCIDVRLASCTLIAMCDVTNPLTGINGATVIYGSQKGLLCDQVDVIESDMVNYRQVLLQTTGLNVDDIPGSGAAGGLGATLIALFGATLQSGVDTVLNLIEFESKLHGVDFVITGEGRLDGQTVQGKVPVGVGRRCKAFWAKKIQAEKPRVIAIVGCIGEGFESVYSYGIDLILSTVPSGTSTENAMLNAKRNLRITSERLADIINGGTDENLD